MKRYSLTAAVLAGGKNSRIGVEKSLLQIGDSILLDNTLEVLDSLFDETLIVSQKDIIKTRYPDRKIYPDIFPSYGALAGIHTALSYASHQGVFIFACDMPNLNRQLISAMAEHYLAGNQDSLLIASHSQGCEPLHSIYCKCFLDVIERQLMLSKLRVSTLFELVKAEYFQVAAPLIASFKNINTREDLQKWLEALG